MAVYIKILSGGMALKVGGLTSREDQKKKSDKDAKEQENTCTKIEKV